jgi:hypothetical protein
LRRLHLFLPALAIAAVALAAVAGVVSANDGGGHASPATVTPGTLDASGDGIAAVSGQLTVHVCATDGILLVRGNATVPDGASTGHSRWFGLQAYFGFNGCADVTPASVHGHSVGGVAVLVVGTGITLHAEGTGTAFLKGDGTWSDGNGGSGAWSDRGVVEKIRGLQTPPCPQTNAHRRGDDGHGQKCSTPAPAGTSVSGGTATPTSTPVPPTSTPEPPTPTWTPIIFD